MNEYFKDKIEAVFTDKTRIRGVKWWKLKHDAMQQNYQTHEWYMELTEEEQEQVRILRNA